MKVIGRRVLVEQTMTKKQTKIILTGKSAPEETFDITFKVLQLGEECPEGIINIGDVPIFTKHVDFHGAKIIEEVKDVKTVLHTIVFYDEIIGVE